MLSYFRLFIGRGESPFPLVIVISLDQKVAYGEVSTQINQMQTINKPAQIVLIVLLIIVFVTGVFPQPLFDLTADSLQQIFVK